jgi:quercetin dioxygenase-like cupin family protein
MTTLSLPTLAGRELERARASAAGRSAATVYGGSGHTLRQTMIALTSGATLAEHANPGEATLHVMCGHVRLDAGDDSWEGKAGDLIIIPPARHELAALDDAVVLLTVALGRQDRGPNHAHGDPFQKARVIMADGESAQLTDSQGHGTRLATQEVTEAASERSEPAVGDMPGAMDQGGDAACWAHRVCVECGRLNAAQHPEVCENCGAACFA